MPILAADGRALYVAMDHARTHGVVEGLQDPGRIIDIAVDNGADGIMTSYGVIKHYRNRLIGRIPTVLRLDGGPSLYREDWLANTQWSMLHTVEDAIELGVDGVVTHFVYDREDVLLEFVDDDGSGSHPPALAMRYLHGPGFDQVLAQENFLEPDAGKRVLWLLPDHLGNTRDLVDNTGAVVNHIIYDAFGRVIFQSNPAFSTRYLFTGREFDAETGLYYYRARYYHPGLGRFVGEDPIRFRGGDWNLYAYVTTSRRSGDFSVRIRSFEHLMVRVLTLTPTTIRSGV